MIRGLFLSPDGGGGQAAPPTAPTATAPSAPTGSGAGVAGESAPAQQPGSAPSVAAPITPTEAFLEVGGSKYKTREDFEQHYSTLQRESNRARLSQSRIAQLERELAAARGQAQAAPERERPRTTEDDLGLSADDDDTRAMIAESRKFQKNFPDLVGQEVARRLDSYKSADVLGNRITEHMTKIISLDGSPVSMADVDHASDLLPAILQEHGINPNTDREGLAAAIDEALIRSHQERFKSAESWAKTPAGKKYFESLGGGGKGTAAPAQPGVATTLPSSGMTAPAPGQAVEMDQLRDMDPAQRAEVFLSRHPEIQ